MPRKKQQFKCPQCGQSFKMAMHLGRHMKTKHASAATTARPAPALKRGGRKGARRGRPKGINSRLGLAQMPVDELVELATAARLEVEHRLAALRQALKQA